MLVLRLLRDQSFGTDRNMFIIHYSESSRIEVEMVMKSGHYNYFVYDIVKLHCMMAAGLRATSSSPDSSSIVSKQLLSFLLPPRSPKNAPSVRRRSLAVLAQSRWRDSDAMSSRRVGAHTGTYAAWDPTISRFEDVYLNSSTSNREEI